MNGPADLQINCIVRRVLVRHWIDLGRLSMRTTRGVVWLRGVMAKVGSAGGSLDSGTMTGILSEIRRIPNVRRVNTDLANWVNEDGMWQMKDENTAIASFDQPVLTSDQSAPNAWSMTEQNPGS